ncbi:pathogenicity island 1 effector protein SopD, partial [Salmonella enterica]|nr:pathogenicity island 1 effector protein SopD [Salmonella enterica]EBX4338298.1 pathogenicity island 1 effector protein SopD [Salmonella enterica subsp. enterica serovar Muenchen]EAM7058927.1 pathogenicity island 1 effector protein SopD [Salmonella enterica]EAO3366468.1 pathogenicity island 1 effector protein SopD [Salmonella enterica]EAT1762838.1 pathogenicity island 1 effector protein SopD [Salmonella enterica]
MCCINNVVQTFSCSKLYLFN